MPSVSIVIPAYNEEGAIGPVIQQLRALGLDAEVIVVDDGSTDGTIAVAEAQGARIVRHPANMGYGRSLKDGVRAASGDVIIITDADGTYPIGEIPVLLKKFDQGFDMVVGARQGAAYHQSPLKSVLRWFLKSIVEFASGRRIPDVNSGLRIFRKSTSVPYFPDICDGFSFTTTITLVYALTHKSIAYVPVPYDKRVGSSKVKLFHDTLRTLQYITECIVRYNPLKLFLVFSLASIAFGIIGAVFASNSVLWHGLIAALVIGALGFIAESLRRPRG